jgi:hypothetical protein
MIKEFKASLTPTKNQLSIQEDHSAGNEGQKPIRHIENQ